jgi:type I restriction-modification system DNA methylase subunit
MRELARMGEELISKGFTQSGIKIGEYEYYPTHDTTLDQYKTCKIICDVDYGENSTRKPDGLFVNRQNKKDIVVIAVLEHKQPSQFRTDAQKRSAMEQCNDVCQVLNAKMGIITDKQVYIWINPRQNKKENTYIDKNGIERSYSIIRSEDKKDLNEPFLLQESSETNFDKLEDTTKNTLDYVNRILSFVNETNSILVPSETVDPLGLAKSVWQDIYINTGKEPEKCLYNVVELFIFKFLSDLGVLKEPYDFKTVYGMYKKKSTNKEVLEYYATNSRKKIIELFPEGRDKTTIINGTIFVDVNGNPVFSQANLFRSSLKKYNEFGTLRNIKKEFKTKLFETFLKESSDKSRLGQFFTPRKVVRAIVDMADVEKLPEGSRFCDPFCGVGGFIAETIQKPVRKRDFIPTNGKITPKITYEGYDKGSDTDQERLIILAKANLLIYISDVVEKYPTITEEFSRIFNDIFHFLTESNLGTLKRVITDEKAKYDLILTNPPCITSGVTSIKEEIKTENLQSYYTTGSKGVDGLALEWIIRNLRKNGRAFVIIPHSILNVMQNQELRRFLKSESFINCIISLPVKTFFNTPQKMFVLGITKKNNPKEEQDFPVFTYLVSDIGEQLNIYRFETEGKSDLEKAKDLFNAYKGSPSTFPEKEIGDPRCKLQAIDRFDPSKRWYIDDWWTKEEKVELGIEEETETLNLDEFIQKIEETKQVVSQGIEQLKSLAKEQKETRFKEETLGNLFVFPPTNTKITQEFCRKNEGDIPVHGCSKNENSIIGHIKDNLDGVRYYENCIGWNRNGAHVGRVFVHKHRFVTNDDHRVMLLKDEYKDKMNLDYLRWKIERRFLESGFLYSNKCGIAKIRGIPIEIPIDSSGKYNLKDQFYLLEKKVEIEEAKTRLSTIKEEMEATIVEIAIEAKFEESNITKFFNVYKGSPKYTLAYLRNHKGTYPVYSSQTTNDGAIGNIDTYDYNTEGITWTTDGINAGTVFYRNGKFSMTTHCGVLLLKEEYEGKIDLKHVHQFLSHNLRNCAIGQGNKRLTVAEMEKVTIRIPITDNGQYDFDKQNEIQTGNENIEDIKRKVVSSFGNYNNAEINFD